MQSFASKLSTRNLWRRLILNGLDFSGDFKRFDFAYLRRDPYCLGGEHLRYSQTNQVIESTFGHPATLLEIGCAEGYQSQYLLNVCDHLHGVDVSRRAVARAKRRCPIGEFRVADAFSTQGSFDVVVACEVLYFVKDVRALLERMSELSSSGCLVTYYTKYCKELDRYFAAAPPENKRVIQFENKSWNVVWWTGRLYRD
jgi:ubiquinone/menaquinone biosynthesis C-methylase UbiE